MDELDEALRLDARKKVYKAIERNPGLHFRELQRRTHLAVGNLQYHLDFLEKKHLIRTARDGKFSRFYSVRGKQPESQQLMALLRKQSLRRIILCLIARERASNLEIARSLGLSPSTTSWHLERLAGEGVVVKGSGDERGLFSLENPEQLKQMLLGYRKSFLDVLVESFAEIWEEEI